MKNTRQNFAVFLRRLVFFAILLFFIIECTKGELSESESFFNFLRAVDPKNVLNITRIEPPSHPCLVKLNGVRCNSNATNIVHIRLENLNLRGIIDADSLCRLQKLRVVSLAKNNIRGTIPPSILHCTRLTHLNVTSNELSGRLPNALTKLKHLRNLDISNNNFSGMIPSKQQYRRLFIYHVTTSNKLESNSTKEWIKEIDTNKTREDPLSDTASVDNGNKAWYLEDETLVALVLGTGLLLSSLYFMVKKTAKSDGEKVVVKDVVSTIKKATTREVQEVKLTKEGDSELVFFVEDRERFTLEDLLRATADLRSESFCSSLYKVKVENNVHYAVKRLKNLQVSLEEFGETLRKISNLNHQNILPLVGYRSTTEEKLIIYKYQSNGSLLNLLNDYIAGRKNFPWKLRLNIACGIARGLAFIYKKLDGEEVIPHGNLKPSNILLDEKNEPLISEHGLSKFMDPNRGFLFSSQGYTAPEKSLTEKGDVYSFGVILLELLTGKSIEVSRIDLARWVRSMVREEWTGEVFDKEVRENEHQWAFPLLNIALLCVSRFQENRPTTMEILEKIEQVMDEHEQHEERSASKCCSNGSNRDNCCSLHKIIPETWDSPGSNY
ncbi:putative inactive receptor kinase, partial [Mucuna pruriens]